MGKSRFLEAVDVTRNVLHDFIFMCESRSKPTYFTREGKNKLNFISTMLFMLNFVKKSFQIELNDFFKLVGSKGESISKQGFSEARKKIRPEAFIKLFDTIVYWFYQEYPSKTFMGFRIFAIDASILEVNNSKGLKEAFGVAKGSSIELARAMASCIYDIENNLIVKALITKCTDGERSVAIKLLNSFMELRSNNDLFLFDRGYPSIDFFIYLKEANIKFIIRTPINNYKPALKPGVPDQLFELKKKGKTVRLRAIRFLLNSGEEEFLITNIMDSQFGIKEFRTLYFKRWGIETKYDELKNKLHIQKFTGDTALSVEQDFYATMFLANMASLIKQEADEIIANEQNGKDLKYEYTVNNNLLIGNLKNHLIGLILENSPRRRKKLYKQLLNEIKRNRNPIRPDRSFNRVKGLRANRNGLIQKSAL
jgi:hypothetical protein